MGSEKSPHARISSHEVRKAAFARAIRALRGAQDITLKSIANRAAHAYLPDGYSALLRELQSYTADELKEIGFYDEITTPKPQAPPTRSVRTGHWALRSGGRMFPKR